MPALVIFAFGQPARWALASGPVIRVGRDPTSDVVLEGETVSREHAAFVRTPGHKWIVRCLSQKNPIVVDGLVVTGEAPAVEGTEVLVGSDHLVIFADNEVSARSYLGGPLLAKSRCTICHWAGLVSTLRSKAACPKCGGTRLVALDQYQPGTGVVPVQDTTSQMSDDEARVRWQKMKEAKHSNLERVDGHEPGLGKKRLSETEPLRIGSDAPSAMTLAGLAFGSIVVRWDGKYYVAESSMKFPAMKVNGVKSERARLSDGDLVEIGSNRFRFTLG